MNNNGLSVRCTICLENNPHTRPIANVRLATIDGRDVFVCREHMPRKPQMENNDERKSVSD